MPESTEIPRLTVSVSTERDHIRGAIDAPVTIVEYGDFECPHCGHAFPVLEALLDSFPDEVRLVYRHFPLANIHPHAEHAAEACEAAAAQDRFWEMHDALFENQTALSDDSLADYANDLGLDANRFAEELREGAYANRVHEDFFSGVRSGVNGTPTLFINGARYEGPVEPEALSAIVQAESASSHEHAAKHGHRHRR